MRVLFVAVILVVAAQQAAACGKFAICETTALFGPASSAATVSQLASREKFNLITKINLYYSKTLGCVIGVKPTYGYDAKNAALLGSEDSSVAGFETNDIKLATGESINKVTVSVSAGCITSLAFGTSKGRTLAKGTPSGTTTVSTPKCDGGYLFALQGKSSSSQLTQVGFIWGRDDCGTPAPAPLPSPPATPSPVPQPSPAPLPSPTVAPEPVASPVPETAPTPSPAAVPEPVPSPEAVPSPAESPIAEVPSPEATPSPEAVPELPSPSPDVPPTPDCTPSANCNATTGVCTATSVATVCVDVGFAATLLDCSSASANSTDCATLVCKPLFADCVASASTPCLGTIEGSNSSYTGAPCVVTSSSCGVAPSPSPAVVYATKYTKKYEPVYYTKKYYTAPKKYYYAPTPKVYSPSFYGRKLLNKIYVSAPTPAYETPKTYTPAPTPSYAVVATPTGSCYSVCGCPDTSAAPAPVAAPEASPASSPVITGDVASVASSTAGPGMVVSAGAEITGRR